MNADLTKLKLSAAKVPTCAIMEPGAFLRSRCWSTYFDPTPQNRESDSFQAPVSKLLVGFRQGRSLMALGGHPLAFTNVGQYWGWYGRVVRSLFLRLQHMQLGVLVAD